jgi:hypothetical protein
VILRRSEDLVQGPPAGDISHLADVSPPSRSHAEGVPTPTLPIQEV